VKLADTMIAKLWDERRNAFAFATEEAGLIIRNVQAHDDATPNANAVMIRNLAALHHLTGAADYLAKADAIQKSFAAEAASNPFGYATLLHNFTMLADPIQIVMSGKSAGPFADERFRRLIAALGTSPIIQWIDDPQALPEHHPARHKSAASVSRAYLCRGQVCAAPAETIDQVDQALELLQLPR
jgi:uncharacterized protein YyaL (SSP411 family)